MNKLHDILREEASSEGGQEGGASLLSSDASAGEGQEDVGSPSASPSGDGAWHEQYFSEDGKFLEGWSDKLGDGMEDVQRLVKGKNPPDFTAVLKSWAHAQQQVGYNSNADFIRIPGEGADEAVVTQFRDRMGVPKQSVDYDLGSPPEDAPADINWDNK